MSESGLEYGELHDPLGIATAAEWGPLSAGVASITPVTATRESVMAIRRQQIHPDQMYPTVTYGAIPIISKEALQEAMAEAAAFVDFAGGTLTLVTERHPTDAPSEMVTIRAMIEWKDRTDARPQPEERAELAAVVDPEIVDEPDLEPELEVEEEEHPNPAIMPFAHVGPPGEPEVGEEPAAPAPVDELPPPADGLDPDELEDEDLSAIPAEAR